MKHICVIWEIYSWIMDLIPDSHKLFAIFVKYTAKLWVNHNVHVDPQTVCPLLSSRAGWQPGRAFSVQNETCLLKHLFHNYRNTVKLCWVAAGKQGSFTGDNKEWLIHDLKQIQ